MNRMVTVPAGQSDRKKSGSRMGKCSPCDFLVCHFPFGRHGNVVLPGRTFIQKSADFHPNVRGLSPKNPWIFVLTQL